jgi:vitamin B12 transporter
VALRGLTAARLLRGDIRVSFQEEEMSLSILFIAAAAAQADAPIVLTGTRSGEEIPSNQVGGSITSLDDETIERRQTREVSDILRDVPGVAVSRVPGQTQVRLRGTEGNHVLVLIDGIEVSDPFTGEFDLGTLFADEGARIEVLRGQQSAIYGSDAIGGVINYITQSGREVPGVRARIEAGSYGTINGAARAAGITGALDYALTATFLHTGGTPNARDGTRDLGNDNGAVALRLQWSPSSTIRLTGVTRYARTDADFNDSDFNPASPTFGFVIDSPGTRFENEAIYGLVRGEVDLLDGRWTHAVSAQVADTTRDGFNAFGRSFGDTGRRLKGSYETTLRFGEVPQRHRVTLAVDAERESFRNTDPTGFAFTGRRHVDNLGFVAELALRPIDNLEIGAAIRHDENDRFADPTTWRLQGSYRLPSGTRLRAAAGTGVKNPGFFELFGFIDGRFIGNPDLRPERSKGWEVGVEQELGGGSLIGLTYFDSRLEHEIFTDFPPPTFAATPANRTTDSTQRGIEAFVQARIGRSWRIDVAYTYLRAREDGVEEARRPDHLASLAIDWRFLAERGGLTLVARYNGEQTDLAFTDPSFVPVRVRLDDFLLVNLNAEYRLTDWLDLFARVENLTDEEYEEVFSFASPGRSAYAGLRARF